MNNQHRLFQLFKFGRQIKNPEPHIPNLMSESNELRQNIADTIQIIKPNGIIVSSIKSHLTPSLPINLDYIRSEIINHSRKQPIEVYEQDLIEVIIEKFYVYYKYHRGIIIVVIALNFYSFQAAEEIMKKIIIAYDETILQAFGQYNLPKYFGTREQEKINHIQKKIREILSEQNIEVNKGEQIVNKAVNGLQSLSSIGEKVQRNQKFKEMGNKNRFLAQRTESIRGSSDKINCIFKFKQYALFMLVIANIIFMFYFLWNYL